MLRWVGCNGTEFDTRADIRGMEAARPHLAGGAAIAGTACRRQSTHRRDPALRLSLELSIMSAARPRIRVVNPTNETVTRNLDAALEPFRFENGPEIVCSTLAEGPYGIESQADVESVVCRCAGWWRPIMHPMPSSSPATAIPGCMFAVKAARARCSALRNAAAHGALARAGRFGVIAIGQRSIPRHMRYLRQMALIDRLAGERSLEMSVAETASGEKTRCMIEVGRELKDGTAPRRWSWVCGMADRALEAALGIP